MEPSAKVIAALLLRHWPDAYCYPCLAKELRLAETDVRDGAQRLLLRPEFRVRHRACVACGRQEEMLELGI